MANLLGIGSGALAAFQRQLTTVGHNIANVDTEGFSRQSNEFVSSTPQGLGNGYQGTGVEIQTTKRQYDSFLVDRVRTFNSSQQEFEIFHDRASQIDNVILDDNGGLNLPLQSFFDSLQDVADDPTSIPAREVALSSANILTDRFHAIDRFLDDIDAQNNAGMQTIVNELNGLAQSIAQVNTEIVSALGSFGGQQPNDLLDQRDQLVNQVSKLVSVTVNEQNDGSIGLFIGNGQSLVLGSNFNTLAVTSNLKDAEQKDIALTQVGGSVVRITEQISGGQLGGLLTFRDQVLDPTQNSLGRVAIGIADALNREHITGMDLDGQLGGNFFDTPSVTSIVNSSNANSNNLTVLYNNVSELTNLDYDMTFNGSAWQLRRTDTSAIVKPTSGDGSNATPFLVDGLSIEVPTGATAGDAFRIRPTHNGGQFINVTVVNARDIAIADPIISSAGGANTGTGKIGPGDWINTTVTAPTVGFPATLTFDSANNQFTTPNPASTIGTPLADIAFAYNPATDSGNPITVNVTGFGDFTFTMSGNPENGDTFVLSSNANGIGDNRNGLRLAALQRTKILLGTSGQPQASIVEAYNSLGADIGTLTQKANANLNVQDSLLAQARASQQSVSGVNLDEEAANLIRYQQAYQAAAQVITTSNVLFDSLLNAIN